MACRIAICDDNPTDAEYLSGIVREWADGQGEPVRFDFYASAEEFLFGYEENRDYDILLLDIEMGRMDGVSMAKKVRQDNGAVQIVFVTGHADYIAEGYEVAALHYLMKPVNREKLFAVLDRALEKRRQSDETLCLELPGEIVLIPLYEILYLAADQNYVTVYGKKRYKVRSTLGELEEKLNNCFFRAGRSLIINLKHIRRVSKTEVHLSDDTDLPIPRGAYEPLNRAIIDYL